MMASSLSEAEMGAFGQELLRVAFLLASVPPSKVPHQMKWMEGGSRILKTHAPRRPNEACRGTPYCEALGRYEGKTRSIKYGVDPLKVE
jgi:hypothetical protein